MRITSDLFRKACKVLSTEGLDARESGGGRIYAYPFEAAGKWHSIMAAVLAPTDKYQKVKRIRKADDIDVVNVPAL